LTDPEIQRNEVIVAHVNSTKPTIIFSSTTLYPNSINSHTTLEFERKEERLRPHFIGTIHAQVIVQLTSPFFGM
jgi:hypothetical protein